jgi:hypothetical protein
MGGPSSAEGRTGHRDAESSPPRLILEPAPRVGETGDASALDDALFGPEAADYARCRPGGAA